MAYASSDGFALERDHGDRCISLEAEAGEAADHLRVRERSGRQRVEEVTLQAAFRLGDRASLGQLDREQRQRVAGHDPVDLRERIGLPDREERLDAPARPDGLDPDVVAVIDEREAEAGPLRSRFAQLLPHPRGALSGRRRCGGERQAVEIQ